MNWMRLAIMLAVSLGCLLGPVTMKRAGAQPPPPTACDEPQNVLVVPVAKQRPSDGVWVAGKITLPLTGNDDKGDIIVRRIRRYGSPTLCSSGKVNCNGASYQWTYRAVDNGFQISAPALFGGGNQTFTIADVEAFYEHEYPNQPDWTWLRAYLPERGWEKVDPADLNYNCHGYTFDKGVWIDPGADCVDRLINNDNQRACYPVVAGLTETKYGVQNDGSHSCKMKIEIVTDPSTGMMIVKGTERREKSSLSAVYKLIDPEMDARSVQPFAGASNWELRKDP